MQYPIKDILPEMLGLYVVDLGGQCANGLSAEEVALLLESERYSEAQVYRIDRVDPNGEMALAGVARERFQLESCMLFYGKDNAVTERVYEILVHAAQVQDVPCRMKWHLFQNENNLLSLILIYPAEYEQDAGHWLSAVQFKFDGAVDGGVNVLQEYYQSNFECVRQSQFWPRAARETRDLETLEQLFLTA